MYVRTVTECSQHLQLKRVDLVRKKKKKKKKNKFAFFMRPYAF